MTKIEGKRLYGELNCSLCQSEIIFSFISLNILLVLLFCSKALLVYLVLFYSSNLRNSLTIVKVSHGKRALASSMGL